MPPYVKPEIRVLTPEEFVDEVSAKVRALVDEEVRKLGKLLLFGYRYSTWP